MGRWTMYGNEREEENAFVDIFNEINSKWRDYQASTLSDCRYFQIIVHFPPPLHSTIIQSSMG